MNKAEIATLLQCPITGKSLAWIPEAEVVRVNQLILGKQLFLGDGQLATTLQEGFLKVEGEAIYYPVQQDILCLLPEFALVKTFHHAKLDKTLLDDNIKREIQNFYNQIGWQSSDNHFQDAKDSEDLRDCAKEYIHDCHLRIHRHLPKKGRYLLDAASGPIQYPDYLGYSENFQYRICADLSLTGLLRAKEKLGTKGIYLLCDITKLPIKTGLIDAVVSLHTLYHVPKNQQKSAFDELYRVLRTHGTAIVVYSWGKHSVLMNVFLLPFKWFKRAIDAWQNKRPPLYFHANTYRWFIHNIQSQYATSLYVWRSVNVPFLKVYVHQWLLGRQILKWIYRLEEKFPMYMGRWGAYPLFVTHKK